MDIPRLNRRHYAALCLTLAASGLGFIFGGFRDGFGVLLLGTAIAWALGCNSRLLHAAFLAAGLLLLLIPGGIMWHKHDVAVAKYRADLASYRADLATYNAYLAARKAGKPWQGDFWSQFEPEAPNHPASLAQQLYESGALALEIFGVVLAGLGIGLLIGVRPPRAG